MRWIIAGTAAAAVLLGAAVSAPASAQQATSAEDARGQHCVVAAEASLTCYDSFREAIARATGGLVADAPDSAATAFRSEEFARALDEAGALDPQAAVSSIEYENPNHNDPTLTFQLGACGSDDSWDFGLRDIDSVSTAWDDRISSYRGYNGCQINHYEAPGYGGERTGYKGQDGDMGAMNNKTSSLRWR